jgi:hypothetical protein
MANCSSYHALYIIGFILGVSEIMRSKRTINEASKYMTIEQLERIISNHYRSECLHYDYDPKSIDMMLAKKKTERNEREALEAINELDAYENFIENKINEITQDEQLRSLWKLELLGE